MKDIITDILHRRGALHIINDNRFYSEQSVFDAMKEALQKNPPRPQQRFADHCHMSKKVCESYLQSGHVWETDANGVINTLAHDNGRHSGPLCLVCGYSPCTYCTTHSSVCNGPRP